MAQAKPVEKPQESSDMEVKDTGNTTSFKFNAQAPEFVPRSHTQMPISGYFYPCFHFLGDTASPDWFYIGDQELPPYLISNPNIPITNRSKNVLPDELQQKIIKQVEYQFSDMSLLANESLAKHMSKDPEGYVPISVVASTKKMKSLISNNHMLAQAVRSSSKLVVSDDGKKVKRKHPFTEKDKEELQSRTVVAENLPEDHSHQNLEKIFSVVGSVKTIRICHPHESNSSRSKGDFIISNKLHALVEYETTDIADKAVDKLSDERNWRKGLRVRTLVRRSPKSVLKNRKSEFDILEDDDTPHYESAEDSSQPSHIDLVIDSMNAEENSMGSKKGWAWGRGKARGRSASQSGRGLIAPSPQSSCAIQCEASAKPNTKGPRMPDGTRGFTMGRGKPLKTTSSP
ncbi:putative lupus La protein [Rosa chinensis]|uniref:Putative lupus La protein n=1 Tax=Rosa chinensis TaxID=74649 RepID=A0A2P6PMS4_ROSCH|nr:la-related protein 6C [Rosa chinensis]PRQ23238.1 putative lupus La protein [Rosa chinensis]